MGTPSPRGLIILLRRGADPADRVGFVTSSWTPACAGCEVAERSGSLADVASSPEPHVVVVDVTMFDREDLLEQLREASHLPEADRPALLLVADEARWPQALEALGNGGTDCLCLPADATEVDARLRTLVELTRGRRRAADLEAEWAGAIGAAHLEAAAAERTRLGNALHADLLQVLAALSIRVQLLRNEVRRDVGDDLDEVTDQLRDAIERVRTLAIEPADERRSHAGGERPGREASGAAPGIETASPSPRSSSSYAGAYRAQLIAGGQTRETGADGRVPPRDDIDVVLQHLVAVSPIITAVGEFELIPRLGPTKLPMARFVSPSIRDVLGYEPEEVIAHPEFWFDRIHPDDLDAALQLWIESRRREAPRLEHDYRMRHADGTYRWIRAVVSTVPDDLGLVYGHFLDITEYRHAEERAARARDEAEAASVAKTEFLSRMSHELRTPLNAVLGFAQLLEMGPLDDDQTLATQQIIRAGSHLLGLINEIVELSRIEAGVLELSLETVELAGIIDEALDLLQPAAKDGGVSLANRVSADHALAVRADRQRLFQVLLNLLSNAVKYNRRGGHVMVDAEVSDDSVRLSVTDNGIGIPSDKLDNVFLAFDRLGAERLGIEGTGIGLTVSKALVERMDGAIGVSSRPDEGSTFWLELPGAVPIEPAPAREVPSLTGGAEPGENLVVLYIEDNSSNLRLVGRVLERRENVRMVPAMQGELGLKLAAQLQPDLVLMDLHLPDMDGIEVLQALRGTDGTAAIPVVVLSADATPANIERLLTAGAQGYLTKPFQIDQLLDIVDSVAATGEPHGRGLREPAPPRFRRPTGPENPAE